MDDGKTQLVLVPMTEGERESSEAVLAASEAWLEAKIATKEAARKVWAASLNECSAPKGSLFVGEFECRKCPECLATKAAIQEHAAAAHAASGKTLKLRNAVLRYK